MVIHQLVSLKLAQSQGTPASQWELVSAFSFLSFSQGVSMTTVRVISDVYQRGTVHLPDAVILTYLVMGTRQ